MDSEVLWKSIVTQHNPLLHQEMQLEIVLCNNTLWNNFAQKCCSLCLKSSEMGRKMVETRSLVRRVTDSTSVLILRAKDEKDHPDCYQRKVHKPASVMVWGCINAHGMSDLHMCEGTIDAEAYVGNLQRHMLPSKRWISQELHVYFSRTKPGLILYKLQHRGFVGIECMCLTGLPAGQIGLLLKMYGAWWWKEWDKQLKSCIHQEWAKIPLAKLQQICSVLKQLQSVVKRKGDATQW